MMVTTLSFASGSVGNKHCCLEFPSLYIVEGFLAGKLLRSSYRRGYEFWLDDPKFPRIKSRNRFCVTAKVKKWRKHDYPWPDDMDPNIKSGHLTHLSNFKPLTEKPKSVTLPFEKPLVDLEKKIIEIRNLADETGLDFSDQIGILKNKYQMVLKDLYTHLTPIQRLSIARHPNRPTVLDHILNITDKWVELHGDRAGYDDPAIVTGIGSIEGKSYMFIGNQKGRNTKENISRNFAMSTSHGYRKALRMMKYADHHGLPVLTFADTPGAFADPKSEELGQGDAIAQNIKAMLALKVPSVTVITGEGGSGGALAISCSNKIFMMENSVLYVASPEACAAILWKSSQAAPKATEKLRITAQEHYRLKIADGVIPEPLGGAHADPVWASQQIKSAIIQAMKELSSMSTEELLHHRMLKYRHIGCFQEGVPIDPKRKHKMKPSQTSLPKAVDINLEIEKLKQDADKEIANAFTSMGLQEKLESLKLELSKAPKGSPNQPLGGNHILKSANLEVIGMAKGTAAAPQAEAREKVQRLKEEINGEIERAIEMEGLQGKIEELKAKMADGLNLEEVEKVEDEIKDKIVEALEASGLKEKVKSLRMEVASSMAAGAESNGCR